MNCIVLVGRLSKDPETRYAQSGTAVCTYSLAVDRRFKRDGEPDADFIDCVVFGKGAEFAEKYFRKGMRIAVNGRLQIDSYEAKDGSKRRSARVMIDNQEFAQSKSENGSQGLETPQTGKSELDEFMTVPITDVGELPFV